MKLHPPIIEGTIPAFYGDTIKVPFTMNKSVGENEINGFSLKLKTIQSNYAPFEPITATIGNWEKSSNTISFILPNFNSLNIGQFYKIQIAYINKANEIGYYSTVGVVKYTSKPDINILSPLNSRVYEGIYSQAPINKENRDYTEKVYSYQFTLTDMYNNIIETSGEQLHNSANDIFSYESKDSYTILTELQKNEVYYLTYTVKTINGIQKSERIQCFLNTNSIDSKIKTVLACNLNYEDGYIDIEMKKPEDILIEETAAGSFYLLRASDEDNFSSWREVFKFVLSGQQPSRHLWRDMTVKQGVTYKYAIQQFNAYGLRSNKIESNSVKVDFEYAFLYDGDKQLKIKYNPKISSFKNTVLESKVDTIGSKYPFIFKNGMVKYKEFPISGLISYLSDENHLFRTVEDTSVTRKNTIDKRYVAINNKDFVLSEEVYNIEKKLYFYKEQGTYTPWLRYIKQRIEQHNSENNKSKLDYNNYQDIHMFLLEALLQNKIFRKRRAEEFTWHDINYTNLTESNIQMEREFKLEVLEWLTNGQPKFFRSPTEGNYIVRLMNVSLSPSDTLGRMIHTFNCTACEIAEDSYENLEKYNFLKNNIVIEPALKWASIDLSSKHIKNNMNLLKTVASSIYLEDLIPGEKLSLTTIEGSETITQTIMIGATGRYIIDLNNNVQILKLSFLEKDSINATERYHQGLLTYGYYSNEFKDSFDNITMISNKMIPCEQFIGQHENILSELENEKETIEYINFIRFHLRNDDIEVYRFKHKYYVDKNIPDENNTVDLSDLLNIYKVNILDDNKQIVDYEWYDGYNNISLGKECKDNDTKIIINGNDQNGIDIKQTTFYELYDFHDVESISIGAAVIAEICYVKKVINYDLEEDNNMSNEIRFAKNKYDVKRAQLEMLIKNTNTSSTKLKECQEQCKIAYKTYCAVLSEAIQHAERG